MKLSTILAAASGALLLVAAPAAAQSTATPVSSHKGFFLGAHLNGTNVSADDLLEDSESGGGVGLQLGWGFTPRLSLFGDLTVAKVDDGQGGDFGASHVDVGVRYAWTGTRRWVPMVEAAFTGRGLGQDEVDIGGGPGELRISGAGFTIGGGVQYFFTPQWAIGGSIKWTGGKFDNAEFDGEEIDIEEFDATTSRINIGVTWYPMGSKR